MHLPDEYLADASALQQNIKVVFTVILNVKDLQNQSINIALIDVYINSHQSCFFSQLMSKVCSLCIVQKSSQISRPGSHFFTIILWNLKLSFNIVSVFGYIVYIVITNITKVWLHFRIIYFIFIPNDII